MRNKVFWTIVVFSIIQKFVSTELFFLIGFCYFIYHIFFIDKGKFFIPFKEYKILIFFLVWGAFSGIINLLKNNNINITDYIRDLFYYINPLVYLYIGAIYSKDNVSIYKIFNALIVSSGILCLIEFLNLFNNINGLLSAFSVESWRSIYGSGVFTSSVALGIIFSNIIPKEYRLTKYITIPCLLVMILDYVISLSRTNLLITLIIYISLTINITNIKYVLKNIFVFCLISIIVMIVFSKILPTEISIAFIDKILNSTAEISLNHDWDKTSEIQKNWRGYETYCAIKQWKALKINQQLIGCGFGQKIYVGKYAYKFLNQVDSNGKPSEEIPVLHNGYATMLIKQGFLGVILYISFYLLIIKNAFKSIKFKNYNTISSKLLVAISFSFLLQTYYLNGLYKDYCFFALIVLLGFCSYDVKLKKGTTNNGKYIKKEQLN